MKIKSLSVINIAFNYVIYIGSKYNIDESHFLKHSMEVFQFANKIYYDELLNNPYLIHQKEIISIASIIHDTCDKKYMDEKTGLLEMQMYMKDYMSTYDLDIVSKIISSMSYSTVNKQGFPELGEYQLAYHVVREADLLSAYDIDRTIIYGMMRENLNYIDSIKRALELCENRILKYKDNLFITEYSKKTSILLHEKCITNMELLKNMINNPIDI
jgi:hypothetical protein